MVVHEPLAEEQWRTMNNTDATPRLLRLDEAAKRVPCSVSTLRRRIHEGALPAVRIGPSDNSPIRIDPRQLAAWLFNDEGDVA